MTANFDLFTPGNVAQFSPCSLYRYILTREGLGGSGTCLFIMLNPSTADAMVDDPTVRRCIGFARQWGYDRLEVANLYAFRATDPYVLRELLDPVGPDNDRFIEEAVHRADRVVCAWGAHARPERAKAVLSILAKAAKTPWCFGVTAVGQPRHPLYQAGDAELVRLVEGMRP